MERVDPQRMKTMAAILRDPYEVHWDHEAVRPLGFDRVINQGPLNLSYVANMLMAWQGRVVRPPTRTCGSLRRCSRATISSPAAP